MLCPPSQPATRQVNPSPPPSASEAGSEGAHLLRVFSGSAHSEARVDLDLHSHAAVPLYAYDAGHPLELLTKVGHWRECVVAGRAPGCNQYVVRMSPTGNRFWALLLPWNHRSFSSHRCVPLYAVRSYTATSWVASNARPGSEDEPLDAIGEGDEGAHRLEKREEDELGSATTSIPIARGKEVEFVLNFRAAQRGRALSLWCPGLVVEVHKRQFGASRPAGALRHSMTGQMGKACDVVAGGYR